MNPIDSTDFEIIRMLTKDGRKSCTDMATKLNLATSTVHKRLETLRHSGIIEQFTIIVDPEVVGMNVTAFIGVNLTPDLSEEKRLEVVDAICHIQGVIEAHELLEPYDFLVKTRTTNINTLKDHVIRPLMGIDGVTDCITLLTTRRHKELTSDLSEEQL